ncbi:hypothetical protein [Nevskia soli]|jgi:hypothetical protein|uniref:hypothetical protein n=1 Tax=Nevskia soli TaxID=418856 RepID=UPI0015D86561|nr:hypothetical protein [Nevskia soli]
MKNAAVPTPYGWILVAQNNFDLDEVVAFQTQLGNLSRAVGKGGANAPATDSIGVEELVPLSVA